MTRRYFHKLIRDAVPAQIEANHEAYSVRAVTDAHELLFALRAKLKEEADELSLASSKEDFLDEYADLMFVLEELKREFGVNQEELTAAYEKNVAEKGRFEKKLILEWSERNN